jgi:hypothetical protein
VSSGMAERGADADFDPELDPSPQADAGVAPGARLEAALAEARRGLKPGEDPFEYDLTAGAGAGSAPASEAHVYFASAGTPKRRRQDTLEMVAKVQVAPAADPRRAKTVQVRLPKVAPAGKEAAAAPSAATTGEPASEAGSRRRGGWALALLLLIAAVGVGVARVWRDPRTAERAEAPSVGRQAGAEPSAVRPEETAAPRPVVTAAPSAEAAGTAAPEVAAPPTVVTGAPPRPAATGARSARPFRPRPFPAPSAAATSERMFGSEP